MVRTKRLRSVVHSIAHHAVSGLCRLHPHLGAACKASGRDRIAIDLLNRSGTAGVDDPSDTVRGAAGALRATFAQIVRSEHMALADVAEASALFVFERGRWPSACHVRVVPKAGRAVEITVNDMGDPTPFSGK